MFLRRSLTTSWNNLPKLIVFIGTLVLLPQIAVAEDRRLEVALKGLDAAMKRIDALETKVGKMSSLEEENRELKRRLVKLETKQPPTKDTRLGRIVTIEQPEIIQPVAATIPSATPATSAKEMWQGVYGGIYGGYGTGLVNRSTNNLTNGYYTYPSTATDAFFADGPTAGGQVGFNYIFANRVLSGVEVDIGWADILDRVSYAKKTNGSVGNHFFYPNSQEISYNYSTEFNRIGLEWQGTIRPRLGYTFENLLVYSTAGLALGGLASSSNNFYLDKLPSQTFVSSLYGSKEKFQIGWTVGAGFEYLLNKNWSVKAEYLYLSLAGITKENSYYSGGVSSSNSFMPPLPSLTFDNTSTGSFGIHQFRLGLNYHTDLLKNISLNSKEN